MQTAAADTPGKYTKKEIVMEEFRFLKPRKMKHPTTGIDLEYLDKSNAVCIALFNKEKDRKSNRNISKSRTGKIRTGSKYFSFSLSNRSY